MNKITKNYLAIGRISKQIEKYENQLKEMVVMDDYDGGQMHTVRLIIADLKQMMWWTM